MTNRVLPIRLWPTGFLAFLGLGGLALLIALWPDWTLRYIHALAWPVVALIAVVTFGPALARRVPSLSALHLPGGFIATFEEQQESFELEGDYAAELTAADAWGAPLDEGDLALPEPPDAAPDPAPAFSSLRRSCDPAKPLVSQVSYLIKSCLTHATAASK